MRCIVRKKYSESFTYEMRDRDNKVVPDFYMMFDNYNYQCRLVKAFATPEDAEKCYLAIPENCRYIIELKDDMIIIDSSNGKIGAYFTTDKEIAISFPNSEDCEKVRELLGLNVFARYCDSHAVQNSQTIYFHPQTFPQYLVDKVIMDIANVHQKEQNPNAMLWAALKILEDDNETLEKKMQVLHVVRLNMEGYFDQQLARMIESKIGQYERDHVANIYLVQEAKIKIIDELKHQTRFKPKDDEIKRQLAQASNSRFAQEKSSEFPARFVNRERARFEETGVLPAPWVTNTNPVHWGNVMQATPIYQPVPYTNPSAKPPVVTIMSASPLGNISMQTTRPLLPPRKSLLVDYDSALEELDSEIPSHASQITPIFGSKSDVSSLSIFPKEDKSLGIILKTVVSLMTYYTDNKIGKGKGIVRCDSLKILLEGPQLNMSWKVIAVCAMLNNQIPSSIRGENLAFLFNKQLPENLKQYLKGEALPLAMKFLGIRHDTQLINIQHAILTRAAEGIYKSRDTINDKNVLPENFDMDAGSSFFSRMFK